MKFRLTYEGPLRPTGRDALEHQRDPIAPHKHTIRRVFHRQLKYLWQTDKTLLEWTVATSSPLHPKNRPSESGTAYYGVEERAPLIDAVAAQYHEFGYRFVPLVLEEWQLLCSLDILFLRRDTPGSALSAGDIDNRIKTLIDALRRPRSQHELVGDDAKPREGEDPFFCLLEDDKQVSRFAVETDTLLDADAVDKAKVLVVITVELRPYFVTMDNLSFA